MSVASLEFYALAYLLTSTGTLEEKGSYMGHLPTTCIVPAPSSTGVLDLWSSSNVLSSKVCKATARLWVARRRPLGKTSGRAEKTTDRYGTRIANAITRLASVKLPQNERLKMRTEAANRRKVVAVRGRSTSTSSTVALCSNKSRVWRFSRPPVHTAVQTGARDPCTCLGVSKRDHSGSSNSYRNTHTV